MTAQMTQEQDTEEEREHFAWANQTPTTRISGIPKGLIFAGSLSEHEEDTGTSFGVIFEDPKVEEGQLFRNADKDEDGLTVLEEDDDGEPLRRATDYRIVDTDDRGTTTVEVDGETFVTDNHEESNQYETADSFEDDTVIVWYNGMSGQIVGRALDFNGLPYAEYKDTGYLVKGLLQFPEGWRDNKTQHTDVGRLPRVARAPILRPDIEGERISIEIGRWNDGRMYEATVTDESGEEIEIRYAQDADEVLDDEEVRMHLHHGDFWQDRPANAEVDPDSFDVEVEHEEVSVDSDGLLPVEASFAQAVVQTLEDLGEDSGQTPETMFTGGLADKAEQQGVPTDNIEEIRRTIYESTSYLDASDIDE